MATIRSTYSDHVSISFISAMARAGAGGQQWCIRSLLYSAVGPCTSCASPSPVRAQRREIGFESLESPYKSSGDHDRRVATSAARSNSATRASISSTHSAARSFTAAGTFGSVRSLSAIGPQHPWLAASEQPIDGWSSRRPLRYSLPKSGSFNQRISAHLSSWASPIRSPSGPRM